MIAQKIRDLIKIININSDTNIIISSLSDSLNPYENLIWSGVVINTDSDSPNQNLNDINSNSFEEFSNEFFFLKTKKLGNV